jgi:hypothetical protein
MKQEKEELKFRSEVKNFSDLSAKKAKMKAKIRNKK